MIVLFKIIVIKKNEGEIQRQTHFSEWVYCLKPILREWIVNFEISIKEWIKNEEVKKNRADLQLEPIRARHNSIESKKKKKKKCVMPS